MQHIKSATNSRNEVCRGDTEISTRQLTTFVFWIYFEADPNGNGYYTEFDISMDGLQEAIDNLEINTDKLDEAIGDLEEKSSCRFRCSHGDQVPTRKNLREIGDFYIVHKLSFIPIPLLSYDLIFNVF